MKRWLYMGPLVLVLVLVLVGLKAYFVSAMIARFNAMGTPKFTVSAATARMSEWRPSQSAVASLHAVLGQILAGWAAPAREQAMIKPRNARKKRSPSMVWNLAHIR